MIKLSKLFHKYRIKISNDLSKDLEWHETNQDSYHEHLKNLPFDEWIKQTNATTNMQGQRVSVDEGYWDMGRKLFHIRNCKICETTLSKLISEKPKK